MNRIFKYFFLTLAIFNCVYGFCINDFELQEVVNVRRTFFNSDKDWEEFIRNEDEATDTKDVYISMKHVIPHKMTKLQYQSIIDKVPENDYISNLFESYYIEKNDDYILSSLTDKTHTKELAIAFKKLNITNYDYAISFYTSNDKSKTGSYGNFSYLFDGNQNFYQCRVNIQQDNRSYILFDVDNPRHCDLYLFDRLYQSDLLYYFPFESLKYCEIGTILSMLKENKLYDEVIITRNDYDIKNKFIKNIIEPAINDNFVDDGARSSIGEYVYISTGDTQPEGKNGFNCSGFVKEVCDNYIRYYNHDFKWMDINELKSRRLHERKNPSYNRYEQEYDPFFGLDWIRNICDQINKEFGLKYSGCKELNQDEKAENFGEFGYHVSELQNVLFRDQQKDNRYIYLVSFNKFRDSKPTIPMFYHVAVIVPIMQDGTFKIRLFESGVESNFEEKVKMLMPEKIHWKRFEHDIKEKIAEQAEIDILKTVYTYSAKTGYHFFNKKSSINNIIKARRILDELEFDRQKIYISKIPLKIL